MAEPRRVGRQPGWREVILVAAVAVAVVMGAAVLTSVLPTNLQEVVFHTPLAIVVLIVGTAWLLWRIARRPPGSARGMIGTPADEPAPPLAPLDRRAADVAALSRETWDVVIVGGGIVGVGALLDAVSRGMRAALVEQDDIAAGTSSRSSRLIHGGLRYLEQFRFGLVREALAERSRLLTLAPHLVRIEPLLFPIYGIPYASKAFYDAGLTLYDILGARHDGGWHRRLSMAETLELAPTLRHEGLRGGLVYHDGIEDDARYTLAVARTAIAAGGRGGDQGPCHGPAEGRLRRRHRRPPCRGPRDRRGARHPDPRRRRRDRRLGSRAGPPVQGLLAPDPAVAAAPTSSCRANASRTRWA